MTSPPTLKIDAAALRVALSRCLGVIERRAVIPTLRMVKILAANGDLQLTATDLDAELTLSVDAETEGGLLSVMADPRRWLSLLAGAAGIVTVVKEEGGVVRITTADGLTARLNLLMPVEDFPVFKLPDAEGALEVTAGVFAKALDNTLVSISTEETRYYLNGVFLAPHEGKLRAVSTDGHRLSAYDADTAWPMGARILPRKFAVLLRTYLKSGGNAPLRVEWFGPLHTRFSGDGWALACKMIDGTYPDYTRVIPKPASAISVAISEVALVRLPDAGERHRGVKIAPEKAVMTMLDPDWGSVSIPCGTGVGPEFGVNLRYLRDFARGEGTIRLEGASAGDPLRVLGNDPALLRVVMPMRV